MKEIIRKCSICDKIGEKSISVEKDDYIHISGKQAKYYHTDCYKIKLGKDGFNKEQIEKEVEYIKNIMSENKLSSVIKDEFYYKIMDIYNITTVPNSYILRVNQVVSGEYKQMRNPIQYSEMLEMLSNPKFLAKLKRLAIDKQIEENKRMFWDLAIIVSEYDNFKKSKLKQKQSGQYTEDELQKQLKTIRKNPLPKVIKKEIEDIDMDDLMID